MATADQIDAAAAHARRTAPPRPNSEISGTHYLAMPAGRLDQEQAERDRAAAYVRRTATEPEPILEALGLPTTEAGDTPK